MLRGGGDQEPLAFHMTADDHYAAAATATTCSEVEEVRKTLARSLTDSIIKSDAITTLPSAT